MNMPLSGIQPPTSSSASSSQSLLASTLMNGKPQNQPSTSKKKSWWWWTIDLLTIIAVNWHWTVDGVIWGKLLSDVMKQVQQATRLYLYISLSVQIFRLQTRIHRNFGSNHCLLSSSMLLRLTNIMLQSNLSCIVINRCYCIVCAFNMLNNVQNKRSVNFIDIVQFYFTNNTTISISVLRVKAVLIYEVSGFINDIFIK